MNREAFENTLKLLEENGKHFNMMYFFEYADEIENDSLYDFALDPAPLNSKFHNCGAAACLAGYMVMANDPECPIENLNVKACELSGMSAHFDHLYMGYWTKKAIDSITREDAIKYLRKALAENNPLVTID